MGDKLYQRGVTIKKIVFADIIIRVSAPDEATASKLILEHMQKLCDEAYKDEDIGFNCEVGEWFLGDYQVFGLASEDYSDMDGELYSVPNIDMTKESI